MKTGTIIAVCTSPVAGVPKYPREQAVVGKWGLKGDFHCKSTRKSHSIRGTMKPNNDRHITIVGKEALDSVNTELDIQLGVGVLGENILVEGLGDLSQILPKSMVVIKNLIRLRVMGQNQPCSNLTHYHPHFISKIYGRRGILCAIELWVGRVIFPGDAVTVF